MKWPLHSKPASQLETPFFNLMYLHARGQGGPDPTIVWISELPWKPVSDFLAQINQSGDVMVGTTHLLIQAVGQALAIHPEFNRRVVGRNVHSFNDRNVCLATRLPGNNEVNLVLVAEADRKQLRQIAENGLALPTCLPPPTRPRHPRSRPTPTPAGMVFSVLDTGLPLDRTPFSDAHFWTGRPVSKLPRIG